MIPYRLKIAAAILVALAGLALAWRSLAPVVAPYDISPRQVDSPRDVNSATAMQQDILPENIRDEISADNSVDGAEAIVGRAFAESDFSEITRDERRLLGAAASDWLAVYLGGSFESYIEMLRKTGARSDLLASDLSQDAREQRERVWRTTGSTVAGRPVSVADAAFRARYIRGRTIEQPDLGSAVSATSARRYGLPDDPEAAGLTIYEIVFPVRYEFESADINGPAWFGIWFARDHERASGWVPYKTVIYDPAGIDAGIVPIF